MKVLDVTEFYSERGGGVRSHLTLKGHVLCQLGHEHVVVAPGARDEETELAVARELSTGTPGGRARVVRLQGPASPYDATYHLLVRFDKLRAIVAEERPDVLEIHSPYLAAVGALAARAGTYGIRTFQWHSDFIDTYRGVLGDALTARTGKDLARPIDTVTRPLWSLVRGIARRCQATLVASRWQEEKLIGHGVPRVRRVPFGIEHATFRTEARDANVRHQLLARLGRGAGTFAEPPFVLVGLGRFAIEKRWDVVLDAFARIRETHDAVLVLFGDGPERARLEARAGRDVLFAGFSKDRSALAAALASADLLVHGCPFETFGLSIAEALSTGLPAIVPDEGGAAEMVSEGATGAARFESLPAGARYRARDAGALAAAVTDALARLVRAPESMRASAAASVAHLPTVEGQFEGQIALYRALASAASVST